MLDLLRTMKYQRGLPFMRPYDWHSNNLAGCFGCGHDTWLDLPEPFGMCEQCIALPDRFAERELNQRVFGAHT